MARKVHVFKVLVWMKKEHIFNKKHVGGVSQSLEPDLS